jgi:hypothetical protein
MLDAGSALQNYALRKLSPTVEITEVRLIKSSTSFGRVVVAVEMPNLGGRIIDPVGLPFTHP